MSALVANGMPAWWTADLGDKAATMISAALAEAGYPVDVATIGANPTFPAVPIDVANRARSLVYLRLGIEFEWCRECPPAFFGKIAAHELFHTESAS